MSAIPVDQDARDLIRDSIDESLLVEAAAGTGKTSELIRRIVSILRQGRTRIGKIVAVTFTRKAAGELKLRLREALDRERHLALSTSELANLDRAAAELEEARIGTIHSFCGDLLRERPVEAGVDPVFSELSEEESHSLFERVFRPWIEDHMNQLPGSLSRVLSRAMARQKGEGRSPLDQVRTAALKILEWRDFPAVWRREDFNRTGMIDRLVEEIEALAKLSRSAGPSRGELWTALRPVRDLDLWIRRAEQDRVRDYDRLEAFLIELTEEMAIPKDRAGRDSPTDPSRRRTVDAQRGLLSRLKAFRTTSEADLAAQLRSDLQGLCDTYGDLKRSLGRLDFLDLLIISRNLLRNNREIRHYFQERFSHIFVDEFQDTDPLQAEILILLSSGDPEQCDWRRVRPVPGKLFLVGDPKQSIYRFRRADVAFYQEIKQGLMDAGVRLVFLNQSFRSVAPIQEAVNAAFEPLMQSDRRRGQADYVPLQPCRPDYEEQPSLIALPVPYPYGYRGVAAHAIERSLPDLAGAFLRWLLNESGWTIAVPGGTGSRVPVSPGHIAILFRRFTSWGADVTRNYVRALEARGVPHVLMGSRSFHQREEVETLRVALAAVEWPDDELSVYATLKGSLFSIPDGLLLKFRAEHGVLSPFRKLPDSLESDLMPVRDALGLLFELHRRRAFRSISSTISHLLAATRAHAGFALRPAGHQVLANIQRVCDLARRLENNQGRSFRAFVEFLESEAEDPRSSEAPVLEEGVDGVKLMTVHSAKGLEFPVVLLADISCRISSSRPDRHLDLDTGLAAYSLMGCRPWDLLDNEQVERERDEAEGVRIAYVAATRARDLLVVPAVGDEPWEGWVSPLNRSLYPSRGERRSPGRAKGCPEFGATTILGRPSHADGQPDLSVAPGSHRPQFGRHRVVWWDPAKLELECQLNFGLRQEQILSEGRDPEVLNSGRNDYSRWRESRENRIKRGSVAGLEISTVTRIPVTEKPPRDCIVFMETTSTAGTGPHGTRFGTLVHTVLRDVDFEETEAGMRQLAELHGRILGATGREIEDAVRKVKSCLGHPLLERARKSERFLRETPLLFPLGEPRKRMVEGTLDLAFLENGEWTVVDFKTDASIESFETKYRHQLEWYVFGMSEITGAESTGWLLAL